MLYQHRMHLFGSYIVKSIKRGKARCKVTVCKTIAMFYYIESNYLYSQSHFLNSG